MARVDIVEVWTLREVMENPRAYFDAQAETAMASDGPSDEDRHPRDGRLRRRVSAEPEPDDVWIDCDEANDPELADAETCVGCPAWGYECWAWYKAGDVIP